MNGAAARWSRRLATRALAVALAVCFSCVTLTAAAQPTDAEKETARSLMDDGDLLRDARDYAGALQRYQAAHDIMKVPTTGIEVAKTLESLGKLVEARRTAIEVANLPVVQGEPDVMQAARNEASALAAKLAGRIPSALIQVWPKEAKAAISVDGTALPEAAMGLPYKTNPGQHVVQVNAPGYQRAEQRFSLEEGGSTTVSVNLVPAPGGAAAPPPEEGAAPDQMPPAETTSEPADFTNAYIAFGIAGAGALVGTVTGVLSLSKASSAKDQCDGNSCPKAAEDDIDSSKTFATVSNIGFVVALAAGAWGLYEVLSQPSAPASAPTPAKAPSSLPRVAVAVAPGQAEAVLWGSF